MKKKYYKYFIILLLLVISNSCNHKLLDIKNIKESNCIIKTSVMGNHWQCIRYDQISGAAWILSQNNWKKIKDLKPLPKSFYSINIVVAANFEWQAIRYDVYSGKGWMVRNYTWIEIEEDDK